MAVPARPTTNPKSSDAEATFLLWLIALGMAIGGLAKGAERSPSVLTALDWLAIPVLQAIAAHSPGFDRFMRQAQPFTWYMIEAATIMLPLFAAGGFYLLLTAATRRRTRMARRQIMLERENAKVREIKDAMDAKEQAGSDQTKAGKSPRPGEAATDAERLKDVFGNQPPEPPEGKKAFSFWRWLLGIR